MLYITARMTDSINARIKQARLAKGLKQREIAEHIGVTNQAVHQWENNTTPGREHLVKLATLLDVTVEYLLTGLDPVSYTKSITFLDKLSGFKTGQEIPLIDLETMKSIDLSRFPRSSIGKGRTILTRFQAGARALAFIASDTSMSPAILENDIVVIDPDKNLQPGDFVVAHLKQQDVLVFLQFSFDGPDHVVLAPINQQYRSYRFTIEEWDRDVQIIGVMTEFTRAAPRTSSLR